MVVEGTSVGTTTDVEGQYSLSAPTDAETLRFFFVGFETMTEKINGRSTIDVELAVSSEMLDEVVVVGSGSTRQADLTGSVSSVSAAGSDDSEPAFSFHHYENVILDIEGVQDWEWWSAMHPYDGSYDYETPASNFKSEGFEEVEGDFVILTPTDELSADDNSWWTSYRSINLNAGSEWVPPEAMGEQADNFALKFEMGIEGDWETGTLQIFLPENNFGYRYEPWLQDDESVNSVSFDGWRTVSIPFGEFRTEAGHGNTAQTLGEVFGEDGVVDRNEAGDAPGFRFLNDSEGEVPEDLIFAIDNIRVVRIAEAE